MAVAVAVQPAEPLYEPVYEPVPSMRRSVAWHSSPSRRADPPDLTRQPRPSAATCCAETLRNMLERGEFIQPVALALDGPEQETVFLRRIRQEGVTL